MLLVMSLMGLIGCDIDGDLPPCSWNVRITYNYSPYGEPFPLKECLRNLHEYVFDENGLLVGTDMGLKCTPEQTEYNLPVGTYTVVAWGNMGENTEQPVCETGVSRLSELQLHIKRTKDNGADDLLYAAIPFKVGGKGRHDLKAALTDAYATISFNVTWAGKQIPEGVTGWEMRLAKVPAAYRFKPGAQLQAFEKNTAQFLPEFPGVEASYIAHPVRSGESITGIFKTYRLTSDDYPVFCLYADGVPVMKEIDLERLFRESDVDPGQARVQQYDIDVTIDGESIYVMFTILSGWEEGGAIGGW